MLQFNYSWFVLLGLVLSLAGTARGALRPGMETLFEEELVKGADALIKDHQTVFTVLSPAKGLQKVRYEITILNKKAKDKARLVVHYDKLTRVKSISGEAYNAEGKRLAKLKKSDIEDRSNFSSFSIFEDNRVKTASFSINSYPYTVVWEYELETTNMMFYPVWAPQDAERLAVLKAGFQVRVPAGFPFRYLEQLVEPAVKEQDKDTDVYSWSIANIPPVVPEPNSPGVMEQIPLVYTAPSQFSVEGYAGSMDSWQDYGKWIQQLNSTQHDLSAEAVEKVRRLTAGLPTQKEKIKAVYDLLQQNTRYVSIQLGIGGWQPFKASFVDEKGYGDCKALSNYTKAMLEAAGISSHYTLIRHGNNRNYLREDFPMSTFNHVILCVPLEKDTVWLECTSQTNPFGFLGQGTAGRKVVLITDEGGAIASTRSYPAEENIQYTEAEVRLEGSQAQASLKRTYEGLQFENGGLSHYLHQDGDEQRKWVYRNLEIPSFNLMDFKLSFDKDDVVPQATLSASLELNSLVSISSKRMFINPNLANRLNNVPRKVEGRKTDFVWSLPYLDIDKVVYHLPEGYSAEFIPQPVSIESKFGKYEAIMEIEGQELRYSRSFKMEEGRYAPEEYNEYVQFMQEVSRADGAKVVLVAD